MLRVLLLIEDYGELMFLQILLSKLGFEVETLKNPKAIGDSLIKVNPDIVVLTGRGKRVNGIELSAGIKRTKGKPKVILLAPPHLKAKFTKAEVANAEAVLDSPVSPGDF